MRAVPTAVLALLGLLVSAAPASADLVAFVRGEGRERAVVIYESVPASHDVTVSGSKVLRVRTRDRITAGPGCQAAGITGVTCATAARRLRMALGSGRDEADLRLASRWTATVRGEAGTDELRSRGSSRDLLDGGTGRDRLYGGRGSDTLLGGTGGDRLFGGSGHDRLYGGVDNDRLRGEAGNDLLNPGQGLDTVDGGTGGDRLRLRDTPPVWDYADCGPGRDRVLSRDRADHRGAGCERRRR